MKRNRAPLCADELHSLAENKRGSMAMVAAERLEQTRGQMPEASGQKSDHIAERQSDVWRLASGICPLVRIGLSATVAPLDTVAGQAFQGSVRIFSDTPTR